MHLTTVQHKCSSHAQSNPLATCPVSLFIVSSVTNSFAPLHCSNACDHPRFMLLPLAPRRMRFPTAMIMVRTCPDTLPAKQPSCIYAPPAPKACSHHVCDHLVGYGHHHALHRSQLSPQDLHPLHHPCNRLHAAGQHHLLPHNKRARQEDVDAWGYRG